MNLSIRTRLTLIILGITFGCIAVGFMVVGLQQVASFREQRLQALSVIADVVGDSSVSALAFSDADDAKNVLDRLGEFPDIEAAALYDAEGKLFTTYAEDRAAARTWADTLPADAPAIREVGDDSARVRMPVLYDGEHYGTIELIASNDALAAQISAFITTLIAISLVLVIVSVLAAWFLQRRITRPIFELADVARRVTTAQDTSLRAPTRHSGEIGTLAAGFNAMLAKLEAREHEVVSSRDTLRAVIDASPVAIIGIDARGTITLWNARATEILRANEGDAIGKAIASIAPDPALTPLWRRSTGESLVGVEVEVAGGDRALAISSAPLPEGGAMVMVADVTERRRVAEALAERATQLQRAQKMDVVGRLAGGVAHDFNNLLTVVLASCQMLHLRSSGRAELKNYIDNIQNAAQRGAALSRRLLAFSRQQAVDARMIDARAVITDLERMVRSVVGENIEVRLDAIDVPCIVMIDQGQLEQVLLNMVLNARDAMPNGGTLTLRTRVVDGGDGAGPARGSSGGNQWVGISISDTGVGMSAETAARVFEPFFTTKGHGTGLGLATADQITRDAGGELTVRSELGRGTTFTLWLPRIGGAEAHATDVSTTTVVPGTDTVLLVEDEPALRNLVQILLAEAGYHVIASATAQEALSLGTAPGVQIDLLLTDVVMPGMSGPQLATELLRRRPEIQVLYMSGYIGDALSEHGLDEAAAALIHKPFKPDHLLKLIRDLLDARPTRRARRASEHMFHRDPPSA